MNEGILILTTDWIKLENITLRDVDGSEVIFTFNATKVYQLQNNGLVAFVAWDGTKAPEIGDSPNGDVVRPGQVYVYKAGINALYLRASSGSVAIQVRSN